MPLPTSNLTPPFNITRASHVVLSSRDLDATRRFYEQAIGLVVTDQTDTHLYLRGIEERGHHSLVFQKTDGPKQCLRMGYRMCLDDDIHAACAHFKAMGMDAEIVDAPYQGPTLHVTDPVGFKLEFCATMDQSEDQMLRQDLHRGGRPRFFDHWQVFTPKLHAAMEFYLALGFRMTEYIGTEDTDTPNAIWLQRKGSTQDLVINTSRGPQLHHFAYATSGIADMINAADTAATMGLGSRIERGPARHGISGALFLYFRDPDGHRVELFTDHYMAIDSDHAVKRWAPEDPNKAQTWGMPGTERHYREATPFAGATLETPDPAPTILSLERYLANQPPVDEA